jgi:hypothetical protein
MEELCSADLNRNLLRISEVREREKAEGIWQLGPE